MISLIVIHIGMILLNLLSFLQLLSDNLTCKNQILLNTDEFGTNELNLNFVKSQKWPGYQINSYSRDARVLMSSQVGLGK